MFDARARGTDPPISCRDEPWPVRVSLACRDTDCSSCLGYPNGAGR
jgi:hypothetical protein